LRLKLALTLLALALLAPSNPFPLLKVAVEGVPGAVARVDVEETAKLGVLSGELVGRNVGIALLSVRPRADSRLTGCWPRGCACPSPGAASAVACPLPL